MPGQTSTACRTIPYLSISESSYYCQVSSRYTCTSPDVLSPRELAGLLLSTSRPRYISASSQSRLLSLKYVPPQLREWIRGNVAERLVMARSFNLCLAICPKTFRVLAVSLNICSNYKAMHLDSSGDKTKYIHVYNPRTPTPRRNPPLHPEIRRLPSDGSSPSISARHSFDYKQNYEHFRTRTGSAHLK